MDELKRILALPKEDRIQSDLDYLASHNDELTEEQLNQLSEEKEPENPLQKKIGEKLHLKLDTEIKQNADGSLRAIVNSGKEDRHGEVLNINGLDIKEYMKNPILANAHDYSKPSVGRTLKLTKPKDGQLIADFKFATDVDGYDEPKILDQLYRKGYQFAFSIGFIPQEVDGNTYTKSTMIEFSPVLIPADGNALLLAKKLGIDKEISKTYNNVDMLILKDVLEKFEKDGADALTLAEVKFLNDEKENLTAKQIKSLGEIIKEEEPTTPAEPATPADPNEPSVAKTLKDIQSELKSIKDANVEVKNINGQHNKTINVAEGSKQFGNTTVSRDFLNDKGEPTKEIKLLHYVRGLQGKDFSSYRDIIGKDAMSTSGNVVLPPAEFIAEIQRLEEKVGVAERYATVRKSTTGLGLKYVLGDDDLEIFDTAESGVKKSTKLTYKQVLLAWRKFAGILPITDELSEDSAIDLWNDATARFARAFSKKADELVFTNVASGGNTKNGITVESGTHEVDASGGFDSITADNLYDMIYGVPTMSAEGGRFFLNREALGVLAVLKDKNDRPLWVDSYANGVPATIAGKPYTETLVLPTLSEEEAALPVIVFGDLKYVTLGMRTDLNIKIFDSGSVGDPEDEDQSDQINLLTQDVQAMRAVKRMNAVVRFPQAFSVLKLGEGS